MLHRAATTGTEMFADWFNAFVALFIDMQQVSAVRMTGNGLNRNAFTGQGARYIDRTMRSIGDTVSTMAKSADRQVLSHAGPQAEVRNCHRLLGLGREGPRQGANRTS